MPLDFNLYLSSDELHVYPALDFSPSQAVPSPYSLREQCKENGHVISGSFLDRKWQVEDSNLEVFESSARFALEQHYNADTTLRNNLSSSNVCILDDSSNHLLSGKSKKVKRKRNVSFADTQGFPLVSVCFFDSSRLPDVHTNNKNRILREDCLHNDDIKYKNYTKSELSLCFEQPVSNYARFWEQLEGNKVALENVLVQDKCVRGTVKVKNLAFEKLVRVRCSYDEWESFTDVPTTYMSSCQYSNTDTFMFEFTVPQVESSLEIALQYLVDDTEFWDNNGGKNYTLKR